MEIKVLGTGCANCKKTKAVAAEAVKGLGLDTPILEVTDIAEIMGYANADSVKVTLDRIRKKIKDGSDAAGLDTRWELHSRPY